MKISDLYPWETTLATSKQERAEIKRIFQSEKVRELATSPPFRDDGAHVSVLDDNPLAIVSYHPIATAPTRRTKCLS